MKLYICHFLMKKKKKKFNVKIYFKKKNLIINILKIILNF